MDSSCVETPVIETCQADFTCAASTPVCGPPPTDYYYWGFETDDGGWTTSGEIGEGCPGGGVGGLPCVPGSSWEWGIPIGGTGRRPFITSAASGSRAWVTDLNGDYTEYEYSELVSPRMDLSSLTEDPVLDIRFISDVSFVLFRYSIDGGPWVAFFGPGPFPDARDFQAGGRPPGSGMFDGLSGAPGEWVRGQIVLTGAAGSSDVRIRFELTDDIGPSEGFGLDEVRVRSGGIR